MVNTTQEIKDKIRNKKTETISPKDNLSTGSTLLNLACSGKSNWGFKKGGYFFLVGDSASGKTFLSLTCLAEAANNPAYQEHRFIYDNAEDGALMNMERFFGSKMANRLESPEKHSGEPVYSSSIEEFYYHVDDAIKAKTPFIYVLDSMDVLTSEDETKKFDQHKKAFRRRVEEDKEEKVAGSYGDGKAKKNSANLRRLIPHLRRTGSILIIINQTRDNIGMFTYEKKTRSGGHALKFYATLELWSSVKEKLTKLVRGQKRQIGVNCKVQIKKNRLTGKERSIIIPIHHSNGIDDIGSCVDFLIEERHWAKKGSEISAKEFDFKGKREDLIAIIEEKNEEKKLKATVAEVWQDIEDSCSVKRKKRYQ